MSTRKCAQVKCQGVSTRKCHRVRPSVCYRVCSSVSPSACHRVLPCVPPCAPKCVPPRVLKCVPTCVLKCVPPRVPACVPTCVLLFWAALTMVEGSSELAPYELHHIRTCGRTERFERGKDGSRQSRGNLGREKKAESKQAWSKKAQSKQAWRLKEGCGKDGRSCCALCGGAG